MDIFRKLGWFFKEQRNNYIRGVLDLVMTALLNMLPPFFIGYTVNLIVDHQLTLGKLTGILVILVADALLLYFFRYLWATHIWGGATILEKILRKRLYAHFMQMDEQFYHKYRTGDLMARATNDLNQVRNVAGGGILTFADSIIGGSVTIVTMMVVVDWRLTLIAILPFPLLALMSRQLGRKMHSAFGAQQDEFSTLNNKVQESLSGMKAIKTLGQEQADLADMTKQNRKLLTAYKRVEFVAALYDPFTSMIIVLAYVVTIIYGGWMVLHHVINIGQLVSFIAYISMLIWPMFAIGRLFNIIERGHASYDRVMEVLNEKTTIIDDPSGLKATPHGDLAIDIVNFTYPDEVDEQPALQNVHATIKAGETLGLVGRVGAGKSSLMKLLLRQFDDYTGSITIAGTDIKHYAMDSYIPALGYVPQENFLFSTTIRDNIRFADPSISDEAVEVAAKKAALHDDILLLPKGYDTEVGEHGISLSGGQRQRLAIARALIIDPEVLILDDALSAVDARTETAILATLKAERANKTTIIAAHRISSVMQAENILVFDHGKIAERGTHQQLLHVDGWYADMYHRQQLESKLDAHGQVATDDTLPEGGLN